MTSENNTQSSDQVDGEPTAAFAPGNPAELLTPAPPAGHATASEAEQLPSGSAAVVVKRGPTPDHAS